MVGAHDLGADVGLVNALRQPVGAEEIVYAPADIPLPCGGKAADIFTLSSLYSLPCFNVRCGKAEICFGAAQPPLTGYELFTPVTRGRQARGRAENACLTSAVGFSHPANEKSF